MQFSPRFSRAGAPALRRASISAVAATIAVIAMLFAAPHADAARPWMDTSRTPSDRARLALSAMTMSEKLAIVHGDFPCAGNAGDGAVDGVPRLGIPAVSIVGGDVGVTNVCNRSALRLIAPWLPPAEATELPAPVARAASWDPAVSELAGRVIGRETRALGFSVSLSGMANIVRDPRVGRAFETLGEDPYLSGRLVTSEAKAVGDERVINGLKHFAANNNESGRFTTSSKLDERTLREIYLPAFESAVKGTEIGAVMCAYNRVNSVHACENRHLLTDILKGSWDFQGWVMSDWILGTSSTIASANNGLDQEQPAGAFFGAPLALAVTFGLVSRSRLDNMVFRILRETFAFGIVDDPPRVRGIDAGAGSADAQEIEERSAVLLKNEDDALPLDPAATDSIAVIGGNADGSPDGRATTSLIPNPEPLPQRTPTGYPSGGGSSLVWPARVTTPLAGISARVPAARVTYDDGKDPQRAAAVASRSDVAIVFARDTQAEGTDRKNLTLDDGADALIESVAHANPHTIVVLETGGPVTMPWIDRVPAVLEAWYPGESAGKAIARLLFGDVNPSGRLPVTFPVSEGDLPTAGSANQWPGVKNVIDYREGVFVGYRWYDEFSKPTLFPFGHGLSYGGRFEYSDLTVSPTSSGGANVSFRLRNSGTRRATEVPQVYAELPDPSSTVTQPPRVLRQFAKVTLDPGESVRVSLGLDARAFQYWDVGRGDWATRAGDVGVVVGGSSRDVRLRGWVRVDE